MNEFMTIRKDLKNNYGKFETIALSLFMLLTLYRPISTKC